MKKFLILFTLMLLVFNYSYSTIMPKNDWEKMNLKGKVKTKIGTDYKYDAKTGKLKETIVTITDFNKQGYITKEVRYKEGKVSRRVVLYEHNKDGLPTKKIIESPIKNNPEAKKTFKAIDEIYSYKYEETKDGNLLVTIKEENIDERNYPSLEKITYDKTGRKIHQLNYSGGELIRDETSIYNEKGKLIEGRDNLYPKLSTKITYEYMPEFPDAPYVETISRPGLKMTFFSDKNGNVKEYISMSGTSMQRGMSIDTYTKHKDKKVDKYGNTTGITYVEYDVSTYEEIGVSIKVECKYEYYE